MKLIALLLLLMLAYRGFTQAKDESHYWSFAIFYDQDYSLEQIGLKSLNEDRNYTLGLGLFLTLPSLKPSWLMAPHYAINRLVGKEQFNDRANTHSNITNSIMFANGTFTPDDLTRYDVVNNDRPYGSLTYLQTLIIRVDTDRFRQYTSTFTGGVIGLYISREVQTYIHKLMNDGDTHAPRTPRGWSNQISNKGEPTIAYTYEEQRLLLGKPEKGSPERSKAGFELKHGWKYSLGYYTMAEYGLNFRVGFINPYNWTYLLNPLGVSNNISAHTSQVKDDIQMATAVAKEKNKRYELYTFGSVRPTFMLYNALLNGQFRKSVYTLNFQDMRHLLLEFNGGIGFSIPCKLTLFELKGMISGRSPEFELPGRPPRWHYWGGLHIIISHNTE